MQSTTTTFWSEVLKSLITEFAVSASTARKLIQEHRGLVTNDGVGDALLHFGPEDFAESLHERFLRDNESATKKHGVRYVFVVEEKVKAGVAKADVWTTFIKRFSANDTGDTGSHQGGSVYIPKNAAKFFPSLRGTKNPSATFLMKFRGFSEPVSVRFVFYRPLKDDRRLTIPTTVMKGVHAGDLLVIRKRGKEFEGAIIQKSAAEHPTLEKELGSKVYAIRDDDFRLLFAKS